MNLLFFCAIHLEISGEKYAHSILHRCLQHTIECCQLLNSSTATKMVPIVIKDTTSTYTGDPIQLISYAQRSLRN